MKRVLVIYFTQTGQLHKAVKATLRDLESDADITVQYESLRPREPFPFPWTYMQFFDAFPETVQGIPCEMYPLTCQPDAHVDLVVIAYQPWFLSISRPVASFLQSPEAARLLKDKPVVTLIACRNMWLNAQEKMKGHLKKLGARLVGNITYVDRSSNLVSLITVLAFALKGVQGRFMGIFPKYGVSDDELATSAWKFGNVIRTHLRTGEYSGMQEALIGLGAIKIKASLMIMEGRGKVLFPLYARFILKKGGAKSSGRRTRVRIFGIVLPTLIFILSPVITIVSRLTPVLFPSRIRALTDYYSRNELR